jgi:allantoinase
MTHDLVITGGSVATMDDAFPRADWVAITHGLISAVGVGDAPEAHQVLDAAAGLILPGFNDAHCHTM